jgi:two-component system CheB/CheR fusion protein
MRAFFDSAFAGPSQDTQVGVGKEPPKKRYRAQEDGSVIRFLAFLKSPRLLRLPRAAQLASAPVAVGLAFLIHYLTLASSPGIAPFVFFYVAIVLAAWLGGRAPGLLTVLLSAALANYAFMSPHWSWTMSTPALAATGLFLVAGSIIALLCAGFREFFVRSDEAASLLRRQSEVLALSHDAIILWRRNGGIEFWNRGAEDLYGFTAEEARGRVIHDLLHTRFPGSWSDIDADLRKHKRWEGELVHRTKDGRIVTVSSRLQTVQGQVEWLLESNRDITRHKLAEVELRQARQSAEWLARLPAENPDPVLRLSQDNTVLYANEAARSVATEWGLQLGSRAPYELVGPAEKAVALGGRVQQEFTLGQRSFLVTFSPMEREVNVYAQDITARKRAEEELKRKEEALQAADRRKDEFLAVLSHELRNPLAPIRNSLYILSRAAPGGEQARRAYAVIERQVAHVGRLVTDLLDVNRIARGKVQLQPVRLDLRDLTMRTVEDHRSIFGPREIELRSQVPTTPVWVIGDATRLSQALGNLLQNAAKFTNKGGIVSVELNSSHENAFLCVRDTGVGISRTMLSRIFEPFIQADATLARSTGGLGLGLALVRGLAELHGGQVEASSEGVGKGAEFTIRIPLCTMDAEPASTTTHELTPAKTAARRVLVIEDNIDSAESLKEALELDRHEVTIAFTGPEGLAKAQTFLPDVVLCDIGLPGMNGYEVARAFRANGQLHDVPLVALTGYASAEDQTKAAEAGFNRHLAKPPSLDALELVLSELPNPHAA